MAIQANALASLSRVKLDLGIETSDTSEDSLLINYINTASDQIETLCNRKFHETTYTHRLTGKQGNYVIFEQFPVTSITEIFNDDKWNFGAKTQLTVGVDVDVDKETFLVRRGVCNEWAKMPMSIRATYKAGYATIPEGLQQACVEYVRYLYLSQSTRRLGTTNRSKFGENVTFEDGIPALIQFLIEPYKREQTIKKAMQLNGYMLFDGMGKGDESKTTITRSK